MELIVLEGDECVLRLNCTNLAPTTCNVTVVRTRCLLGEYSKFALEMLNEFANALFPRGGFLSPSARFLPFLQI
jgi:hypothetical protein